MMITPETYYSMCLQGKTKEEIMQKIRSLKRQINKLKTIIEEPSFKSIIEPSESVQIKMNREYLQKAITAYNKAGGEYVLTARERKIKDFDENIKNLKKITLSISDLSCGCTVYTLSFEKDNSLASAECINIGNELVKPQSTFQKDVFFKQLEELHISEWNNEYFAKDIPDGVRWHLILEYYDGKRDAKYYGNNRFPFNFSEFKELVEETLKE